MLTLNSIQTTIILGINVIILGGTAMYIHPIIKRVTLLLFMTAIISILLYVSFPLILPFLMAILFTIILRPIILAVQSVLHIPYLLSCLLVIFFFLFFIFLFLGYLLFELFHGIIYLTEWLPVHLKDLIMNIIEHINQTVIPPLEEAGKWINTLSPDQQVMVQEQLEEIGKSIAEYIGLWLEVFFKSLGTLIVGLPGHFTMLFFSILCTFFFCKDWDRLVYWIKKYVPNKVLTIIQLLTVELKKKIFHYTKAQIILLGLNFLTLFIALSLFQIPYALTISAFITVIDLLPILGTGIVLIPWAIYLWANDQVVLSIGLICIYALIVLQRQLLEPKLVSNALGIHPLAFIIAIYIGITTLGMSGLWLGPITLFLLTACKEAQIFQLLWRYIRYNEISFKNDES